MEKENIIKLLIDDEKEAIDGYTKYLDSFNPEQRAIIEGIIKDELRHIDLLKNMLECKRLFGE